MTGRVTATAGWIGSNPAVEVRPDRCPALQKGTAGEATEPANGDRPLCYRADTWGDTHSCPYLVRMVQIGNATRSLDMIAALQRWSEKGRNYAYLGVICAREKANLPPGC